MLPAFPIRSTLVKASRFMDDLWRTWFDALLLAVNAASYQWAHVSEPSLDATQAAVVAYQTKPRVEAVYTVAYAMRVITPSGGTSTLTFTLGWTSGGVAQSESRAAITGNLTTTQQNGVFVIKADAQSDITYTTTHGSTGAPTMAYELDVLVSQEP